VGRALIDAHLTRRRSVMSEFSNLLDLQLRESVARSFSPLELLQLWQRSPPAYYSHTEQYRGEIRRGAEKILKTLTPGS
jgi:hypothetical protein